MRGAVYVNGSIAPADQAVVPVYDHGFVYGEGVYETLRTYNRVPFLYDRHILRNHPGSVNPAIKSNNLLNNAIAMQAAYRRGADEALMCNYRGELSECSQANVFLVRGGVALTPRTSAGLLDGVTRTFLFEVGQDVGIGVREEVLYPKDLETADEMFITSTTRELSPVVAVDDRTVGAGKPGPVTAKLLDGYRARAREITESARISTFQ